MPRKWRGIGEIPASGWALRDEYARFDADRRFGVEGITAEEPAECIAGEVLQGHKNPSTARPSASAARRSDPLGAPMVSAEGACAAYYRYRRQRTDSVTGFGSAAMHVRLVFPVLDLFFPSDPVQPEP